MLLVVISMLFLLFSLAYLERSRVGDWQWLAGFAGAPLASTGQLWFNTALLAASSAALQWARMAARREQAPAVRHGVVIGAALAVGFLAGQINVWQDLVARGHLAAANPANGFFYLITGAHGAHLLGGLIALSVVALLLKRGGVARARTRLALCSVYWHFLFVLWLAMFALLASPRDALEGFAAICGFR
ncbi:MAG: cytochrome C oxidase subunit III [Betaproteobacteria bacterium]|nr:MAG: cytochrome C oxidase subunit III [Betaproteobacteria bacterium]